MLLTERPDRFCDAILDGKMGVLVDGSSMAIICPQAFTEFFKARKIKTYDGKLLPFFVYYDLLPSFYPSI